MTAHQNKKVFVVLIVVEAVHESKDQILVALFIRIICNFVNARGIVRHLLPIGRIIKSVILISLILHEITKMITWSIVVTSL